MESVAATQKAKTNQQKEQCKMVSLFPLLDHLGYRLSQRDLWV